MQTRECIEDSVRKKTHSKLPKTLPKASKPFFVANIRLPLNIKEKLIEN